MSAILITQCLQNDFVKPFGKYEPFPNKLHIGSIEAERLLGEISNEGPVAAIMNWAYSEPVERLKIIHIRDWHDNNDTKQVKHLKQFGQHCIKETEGANFVFEDEISHNYHHIINASGLNDFIDTDLQTILDKYEDENTKVGLIGVWTDAKINYLAYELVTRYPKFEIAICSALTASFSTSRHFIALDHISNLLGVKVFSSIADFTSFLSGSIPNFKVLSKEYGVSIIFKDDYNIADSDKELLKYLFRDSKEVVLKVLDGGFSGNVVLKGMSVDMHGHKQVPSVVKIGSRKLIAQERDSFERIKDVLGNNAPNITDSIEDSSRGAIKYRYAAMYGEQITTFQNYYINQFNQEKIKHYLDIIFTNQLGRLYEASKLERFSLLSYYDFSSKYAKRVKSNIESIIGKTIQGEKFEIEGHQCYNPVFFYANNLDNIMQNDEENYYKSFIHGDLNGANVLIDGQENVWLIDFFHTHYGHNLKDFIKLENDLLFIFMDIENVEQYHDGIRLIDLITEIHDLAIPPELIDFKFESVKRASQMVVLLRSYYANLIETIRDPYQYFVAMLRYSIHTLSFDESNIWQKKLAIYMASICTQKILAKHSLKRKLRLDFLTSEFEFKGKNKVALTILPGRQDMHRDLLADIQAIKAEGINNIVSLVTEDELKKYGVSNLLLTFKKENIAYLHVPIKDQGVPSSKEVNMITKWIDEKVINNEKVLIHCVGGLGRTGTIAALYLKVFNPMDVNDAIEIVRNSRSKRAIESKQQLQLVNTY